MRKNRSGYQWYRGLLSAALTAAAVLLGGCHTEALLEQAPGDFLLREKSVQVERTPEESESVQKAAGEARKLLLEEIESAAEPEPVFLCEDVSRYAYESLNDSEKLWYRDIEQALGTMAESVKLSEAGLQAGLDENVVDRIFQCVLSDHPELFFVEGYTYTKYTRAEKTVAIEFAGTCSMDRQAAEARKREIEAAVEPLLEAAPKSGGAYEKVRYVYETLILNTDYDMEAEDNQNIYSVFVNRSSVCQGYAKAAQYLLNRLGVFCTLVQGRVLETGEGHAWNLVKLDGDYYYMDTTWGDISYQTAESGIDERLPQISYDYLCVTTEQLQKTHCVEETIEMPVCTATRDNYYVREGALFTQYDGEKLARLADSAREQGREALALRCTSEACYRQMQERLVDRQEIFNYLSGAGSFVYAQNDEQWTLTFFMMTSE